MNALFSGIKGAQASLGSLYAQKKTIEGYSDYFDYKTFEKQNSKQSIIVSDRTANVQFSKLQNKIYRSVVTIQYHTKYTNPLYPKFTSKKISFLYFGLQHLPGNCLCSIYDHRHVFTPAPTL